MSVNDNKNTIRKGQQNDNKIIKAPINTKPPVNPPKTKVEEAQRFPRDSLSVQNGSISSIQSEYMFSSEATQVLERHFRHLLVSGDRQRFRINSTFGYKPHRHALGAFLRAHFHNLVLFKHAPNGKGLDIGGSLIRTLSGWQDSKPLIDRVFSTTPLLDVRDQIRDIDNADRIETKLSEINNLFAGVENFKPYTLDGIRCKHVGGSQIGSCECQGKFKFVTSVDSAYYRGVLPEMFNKCADGSVGYVVINDYFHAFVKQLDKGKYDSIVSKMQQGLTPEAIASWQFTGEACKNIDDVPESNFLINLDSNRNFQPRVKSFVQGNPMPYVHDIPYLGPEESFGYQWQDKRGKPMIMHFEQLECVWNGDIPYKLFKVRGTDHSLWTPEQLEDLKIRKCFSVVKEDIYSKLIDRCVKIQPKKINDAKAVEILEGPTPYMSSVPIGCAEEPDVFDVASHEKKLSMSGEKILDLKKRSAQEVGFFEFVKRQLNANQHSISIKYHSGVAWMYTRRYTRFLGLFGKFEDKDLSCRAKLSDVLEAYLRIGIKKNTNSILHAMNQQQRDDKSEAVFLMSEAYTIARIIRDEEQTRFEAIIGNTK